MLFPVAFAFTSLVAGETCPAPLDVEQRVRAILHLSAEQKLSEGFIVERREAGLFVELRGSDATVIGQRTLPSAGSCDELAQAAAVVLSAWLTDVHPDFAGALPEPESEPQPEPQPEAPASPPPPLSPPSPRTRAAAPVASRRLPAAARRLELGLGVGAQLAAEKLSLAGLASLAYLPEHWGWGAGAFLTVDTARRQPLGEEGGSVVWRRWPFGLGPSFRLGNASVVADLTVGPALAWLQLRGADFSPSRTRNAATWAGFAQLHLATRGKASIFASGVAAYYASATAYAADAERDLARLSVTLCVGANLSP